MDGELLTAVRTGAASGVATDALARKNAAVSAVIGAGVQGMRQLEAVCCVRTIREALVFDPDRERAETFATEMGRRLGRTVRVVIPVVVVESEPGNARPNRLNMAEGATWRSPVTRRSAMYPASPSWIEAAAPSE